jgi:hypothetical protein
MAQQRQQPVERRYGRARRRHVDADMVEPAALGAEVVLHVDHNHRAAREIEGQVLRLGRDAHRPRLHRGAREIGPIRRHLPAIVRRGAEADHPAWVHGTCPPSMRRGARAPGGRTDFVPRGAAESNCGRGAPCRFAHRKGPRLRARRG